MHPKEKIYYALGELAYVVAMSDGEVQNSEIYKLHEIVVGELKKKNAGFEYSDVIFNVLSSSGRQNSDLAYNSALKELKEASAYLTPEIKEHIMCVLKKVAESYDGIVQEERDVIFKVEKDLEKISN